MLSYMDLKRMATRIALGVETENDKEYIRNNITSDEIKTLYILVDKLSPSWNYEIKEGAQ